MQHGKKPASNTPMSMRQTTMTRQSFAKPIPSMTMPQLKTSPFKSLLYGIAKI